MAIATTQERERSTTAPLGRVTAALLDRLFTPHGASAYLRWVAPSPAAPVAASVAALDAAPAEVTPSSAAARRLPERQVRGTGKNGSAPEETGSVHFARSGLTSVAEGTLLETAEAAGLEPKNRCRRGICGTCVTPKLSGTVVDLRTGQTSDAAGPIRICVSVPQGDVALDL